MQSTCTKVIKRFASRWRCGGWVLEQEFLLFYTSCNTIYIHNPSRRCSGYIFWRGILRFAAQEFSRINQQWIRQNMNEYVQVFNGFIREISIMLQRHFLVVSLCNIFNFLRIQIKNNKDQITIIVKQIKPIFINRFI